MSERKYTDEEIVKALEVHSDTEDPCVGRCPYSGNPYCSSEMARDAIDLINRKKADVDKLQEVNADLNESLRIACEANKDLQAEVEELEYDRKLIFDEGKTWQKKANALQVELDAMRGAANSYKMHYENAKAEAIKDFAERLKQWQYESSDWSHGEHPYVVEVNEIDNLVAEMTEGE